MIMENILVLSGVLQKRIWGGYYFRDVLNITDSNEAFGEYWTLSAHPHGESIIINGKLKGKKLSEVYAEHRYLFANIKNERFPLLVKYIDAADDLSVQVHPGNIYAQKYENEYGKNEFWYVLDCDPDANLILGHNASTKEELIRLINENKFSQLLKKRNIKPGDYFLIKDGIVNAICKGTIILEIQQSSDVTYRIYDYDRTDKWGKKRELHLEKAIDVIKVNQDLEIEKPVVTSNGATLIYQLTDNQYFKTYRYVINNEVIINNYNHIFYLGTVISGKPLVDDIQLLPGQSFIITSIVDKVIIGGKSEIIISTL